MAGTPEIARANGKKGGRPKGTKMPHTIGIEKARARMVELVTKRIDDLVKWLFIKAYSINEETGQVVIDVQAIKELLDRGYGRPAQAVDLTSKGESVTIPSSPALLKLGKEYEEKLKKEL